MTRTYSRDDWFRAKADWDAYGPAWSEVRRLAADRGMLFPPHGTADDDADSLEPSQRAIVWRAMQDNPAEFRRILTSSRSWSGVVDRIFALNARLRADADWAERDIAFDRDQQPTHREAAMSLSAILKRIEESA